MQYVLGCCAGWWLIRVNPGSWEDLNPLNSGGAAWPATNFTTPIQPLTPMEPWISDENAACFMRSNLILGFGIGKGKVGILGSYGYYCMSWEDGRSPSSSCYWFQRLTFNSAPTEPHMYTPWNLEVTTSTTTKYAACMRSNLILGFGSEGKS